MQACRARGVPILDLTESNPTRAGFDYPAAAILQALSAPGGLVYQPSPAGLQSAREAVARTYHARGCDWGAERVFLTASTSEAYAYLFKLVADPGDRILVPRPSYPLFELLASMELVEPRPYPLVFNGRWAIDFDALEAARDERCRAVVVVNPNNPTGNFLRDDERDRLLEWAERHALAVLSDEVFSDYPMGLDPRRAVTLAGAERGLVFCLGGLSKSAGLPQLKVGWIVLAGEASRRGAAAERLELLADTYLSVGTPVQCALPALLEAGLHVRSSIRERLARNLATASGLLASFPECRLLAVEGGWSAVLRIPRTRGEEAWVVDFLREDGVLIHPGYFYDFAEEAYLVTSLLVRPEVLEEGLTRLLRRLSTAA